MPTPTGPESAARVGGSRLDEERSSLVYLRLLPGLSDGRLRELLDRHGSARAVRGLSAEWLGAEAAAARGSTRVEGRFERAVAVIEGLGVTVAGRGDAAYPAALRELYDPPSVVFLRGRPELASRTSVAVVGSRRATEYGLEAARSLAAEISRAGLVVVSGMARGVDAAAHEAALDGGTIGVLGTGIDVPYPPESVRLHERVATGGLLVSEFPPGDPAMRHHFPRRNRLIAALVRGVVVVEASRRSGALITVGHALDLGREVFAVPGPVGRVTSEGTNALIQDGAKLVTGAADILQELGLPLPSAPAECSDRPEPRLAGPALEVWRALSEDPLHVDALAGGSGLATPTALAALLELELTGHAAQLPGLRFVRARHR